MLFFCVDCIFCAHRAVISNACIGLSFILTHIEPVLGATVTEGEDEKTTEEGDCREVGCGGDLEGGGGGGGGQFIREEEEKEG